MLALLPERSSAAAGQMALDYLLFEWMSKAEKGQGPVRLRRFIWPDQAVTFGVSQKWKQVQEALAHWPEGAPADLCRRITGGGIVPHGQDLTWALLLPARHPLVEQPAPVIYRALHEVLRKALGEQQEDVVLWEPEAAKDEQGEGRNTLRSQCFAGPEPGDLVWRTDGRKLAGAAMKRGRKGLLWEGSLQKAGLQKSDEALHQDFAKELSLLLGEEGESQSFPDWPPEAEDEISAHLAGEDWLKKR
ncbi:MAG: hypothetical protein JJT75_03470 [Opitutales bacterium]|nr:hypothetical protein [Opitutales bacterium]MCH8540103.1 hypothetical protein [Opitutales bacterium]